MPSGRALLFIIAGTTITAALSGCGATSAAAPAYKAGTINQEYAGTTITVMLPPWGNMPKSQLAKFTKETGIHVNLQILAWADIHDKVVTAEAAHIAPYNVGEVDWSWVGQFSQAGWYTPLNNYIAPSLLKHAINRNIFTINNQLIAMPYNFGFKETTINLTDFHKAGITSIPKTWGQLLHDAQTLKNKGIVQYPIGFPLSIGESNSTNWFALVKSAGGSLFNAKGTPEFTQPTSPGYQALSFERQLYQDGLIPPGVVSLHNLQVQNLFGAGQIAIALTSGPLFMSSFKSSQTSKVYKDDLLIIPLPGHDGHRTGTFGLPEGLGIPKLSTNKGASAMFINWWMQAPQLLVSYKDPNMGNLPSQTTALNQLVATHQLLGGKQIEQIEPTVSPLFPHGTPVWYPQFSTDAATTIQSVVEGHSTVQAGLDKLAGEAKQMEKTP